MDLRSKSSRRTSRSAPRTRKSSMTESGLLALWRKHLLDQSAGMHLVDPSHSLQVFIGITDQGAARLVIRSTSKPSKPALSDLVLTERYEDQAGKWNLSLTLQDPKFI